MQTSSRVSDEWKISVNTGSSEKDDMSLSNQQVKLSSQDKPKSLMDQTAVQSRRIPHGLRVPNETL